MNVYMIYDRETGKSGTCYNLAELSRILKITPFKLLGGKDRYAASLIGGKEIREEYKTIDLVAEWLVKHSGTKLKGWTGTQGLFLTAFDWDRESRSNSTAMINMLAQSSDKYGSEEELDDEIKMSDEDYIKKYYGSLEGI